MNLSESFMVYNCNILYRLDTVDYTTCTKHVVNRKKRSYNATLVDPLNTTDNEKKKKEKYNHKNTKSIILYCISYVYLHVHG